MKRQYHLPDDADGAHTLSDSMSGQTGRQLVATVLAGVARGVRKAAPGHHAEVGQDDGNHPTGVPQHPASPRGSETAKPAAAHGVDTGPRPEDRLVLEASRFLKIDRVGDLARLRRVVDWYTDTTNYDAFTEAIRRDGLDSFFVGLRKQFIGARRPSPSAVLSADTIRMLCGPTPEEPDYWRSLSFEDRRTPITVGDQTRLRLHDRTEVIEGPGDQADKRVVVHDNSWEMTPEALHAFLVQMVGGQLTPFEENLVANWNSLKPIPQFDGPQIVAYYLVSGESGLRSHQIYDPNGNVVVSWSSEAGLVNEGLGLIDYLLMGRAALQLGGLALRAGARMAVSGASNSFVRNTLLSLRLATRRLGRPLGAALEGTEAGIGVPEIGGGRPAAALVVRESASIGRGVPGTSPSTAVPRTPPPAQARLVASEETAAPSAARPRNPAPAGTPAAPLSGVGRERAALPAPPRDTAPAEQQTHTQPPPARQVSSASRGPGTAPGAATGQRPGQPTTARTAPTDLDRGRQLTAWEKNGKVTGDVQGLRKRLRSGDAETLHEARAEVDELRQQISQGQKPHIEDYGEVPAHRAAREVRSETISTATKSELENSGWLKKRLPDPADRREIMDWLKSGHRQGELGEELPEGKSVREGHDHYRPGAPDTEEMVKEWERTKGRRPK
ncbi:hypothetical protein ACGF3G_36440 [Streptomyces sp. NPDC048179]|uniref:hypothetical protein n=1 Tax=Streptomyces sp. NPDC048179 TaxID=3365506 RepID=UPI00371510C2